MNDLGPVCRLFNDVFSNSGNIATSDRMIASNEWVGTWKDDVVASTKVLSWGTLPGRNKETTEILNITSSRPNSMAAPPRIEVRNLADSVSMLGFGSFERIVDPG
jgi:hypothetical protein